MSPLSSPDAMALLLKAIQRMEEVAGDTKAIRDSQERLERTTTGMDTRMDTQDDRMDLMDRRMDGHDRRLDTIESLHQQQQKTADASSGDRKALLYALIGTSGSTLALIVAHFFRW